MTDAGFRLSRTALREVAGIVTYLHSAAKASAADKVETFLFRAFNNLASGRAVGHKRSDLTDKKVLFYMADPYAIVFQKSAGVVNIVHVIHASRDLKKLL